MIPMISAVAAAKVTVTGICSCFADEFICALQRLEFLLLLLLLLPIVCSPSLSLFCRLASAVSKASCMLQPTDTTHLFKTTYWSTLPASTTGIGAWPMLLHYHFVFLWLLRHPTSLFRSDGCTVLHRSIRCLEVVRLLVGAGADVNAHTR
jgi:hypothetical protein